MKITQNKYEWAVANLKEFVHGVENKSGDLNEKSAKRLGLSQEQLQQKSRNGKRSYVVISEWSRTLLKDRGLIEKSERGTWILTTKGIELQNVSIEELRSLPNLTTSRSENMNYLSHETLIFLLDKIKFKDSTPTPNELTNLLFNTLALANVSTEKSVVFLDLKPNVGEHRKHFMSAYESLVAVNPDNAAQGTLSSFGVANSGFEIDTTPPRNYLNSRLLSAIKRRGDSKNPPGFILNDMKLKLEDDLASFKDAVSKLKDEDAKSALAIFALRHKGTEGNKGLTKESAAQLLKKTYGVVGEILANFIHQTSLLPIEIDRLAAEPAPVKESTVEKDVMRTQIVQALAAKPFVILAGGTGTGKTRAAKLAATTVTGTSNVEVTAVGADWTDNRPLLGFRNLLTEGGKTYVAPPALRIIVKALSNPGSPYFLILDEMNLSHVERYFADFLSSMESKEPLKLHDSADALKTEDGIHIDGKIPWPSNLFVIGTVNIDETTYMFSPKVLDRAYVSEFKVTWDEIEGGLEGAVTNEADSLRPEQVQEFMRVAQLKDKALSDEDHEALINVLRDMHEALDGSRFVFAHRTARECLNFIASAQALAKADIITPQDTKELIDLAILQKALPKLNGASGTLSKILEELIKVADKHDLNLCKNKLEAMSRQLKADQFVSFIQ
jgi:hypothetical protein